MKKHSPIPHRRFFLGSVLNLLQVAAEECHYFRLVGLNHAIREIHPFINYLHYRFRNLNLNKEQAIAISRSARWRRWVMKALC